MSERRGIWSPLANPIVYELFHHAIGARRWLQRFTDDVIEPRDGDCVLDIGCGPGALLQCLPASIRYVGFDRNEAYIKWAEQTYGNRGTFICDDIANVASHALPKADIAVAIGLLHHVDDSLAVNLLRTIAGLLTPTGRLVTVDPCFHPDQSSIQRFVASNDRGMHVRPFERYADLSRLAFPNARAAYQRGYAPIPYSLCVVRAARSEASLTRTA